MGLRRDAPIGAAALAKQVQSSIVAEQLEIAGTLVDDESLYRSTIERGNLHTRGTGARPRPQRAQLANQIAQFAVAEVRKRRHPRGNDALTNHGPQILVGPERHARGDRRAELAAITVGAMARRAAARECASAGVARRRLRERAEQED